MVSVEYHADLKEVQSDPQLGPLLGEAGAQAPFDRLAWWRLLETHCGLPPLLVSARDVSGVAVLPLRRGKGQLEALTNWYSFRVRPVLSPGADGPGLLTALARNLARRTRHVILAGLPDEDGSATLVARAFRKAGWSVFSEACDSNHILPVMGRSFAEYLASRPGKLRTTLKRKAGKVQVAIVDCFDPEAWDAYEAIYAASWKPAEGSPEFLRAFAAEEAAAGRLRFGMAFVGGQPVAAQFWTVEGGTAFIHKLAHLESAREFSPGTILTAALFERVIDGDKVELVDFGTGDDPYKRDWMDAVRPRYRLEMLRRTPANWPRIARLALRKLAPAQKRG